MPLGQFPVSVTHPTLAPPGKPKGILIGCRYIVCGGGYTTNSLLPVQPAVGIEWVFILINRELHTKNQVFGRFLDGVSGIAKCPISI